MRMVRRTSNQVNEVPGNRRIGVSVAWQESRDHDKITTCSGPCTSTVLPGLKFHCEATEMVIEALVLRLSAPHSTAATMFTCSSP